MQYPHIIAALQSQSSGRTAVEELQDLNAIYTYTGPSFVDVCLEMKMQGDTISEAFYISVHAG